MKRSAETYELLYGTLHCVGRAVYTAGTVATEAQARDWVAARTGAGPGHPGIPGEDPVRWCPVRHCHMKRQKPWVAYRKVY